MKLGIHKLRCDDAGCKEDHCVRVSIQYDEGGIEVAPGLFISIRELLEVLQREGEVKVVLEQR